MNDQERSTDGLSGRQRRQERVQWATSPTGILFIDGTLAKLRPHCDHASLASTTVALMVFHCAVAGRRWLKGASDEELAAGADGTIHDLLTSNPCVLTRPSAAMRRCAGDPASRSAHCRERRSAQTAWLSLLCKRKQNPCWSFCPAPFYNVSPRTAGDMQPSTQCKQARTELPGHSSEARYIPCSYPWSLITPLMHIA